MKRESIVMVVLGLVYATFLFGFMLSIALSPIHAEAQTRVSGVVPGKLWRTTQVSGEVEVFHIWGRIVAMPVKDAWVNIDGDDIAIGARCDDPVLDGKPRKGYYMAHMGGKLQTAYPAESIQTITDTQIMGYGDDSLVHVVKTAMISMKDGKPVSLIFTCTEYAMFDVPKFIEEVQSQGELAKRETETLQGFNARGFRQRRFEAVFGENAKLESEHIRE